MNGFMILPFMAAIFTFAAAEVKFCGQSNADPFQDRIVGGSDAIPHEFPWLVKLLADFSFFCGASVISDRYVLTAAHCLTFRVPRPQNATQAVRSYRERRAEDVYAELGGHNVTDVNPFIRQGRKIIVHPDMEYFISNRVVLQANDIALLQIDPIEFTANIAPICLPEPGEKMADSNDLILAGWGSTTSEKLGLDLFKNVVLPKSLQKTSMRKLNFEECVNNSNTKPYFGSRQLDDAHVICLIGADTDSCRGDSGGPAVANVHGTHSVEGIVSWGIGCNQPDFPSAYMRVSSYIEFIKENTKDAIFLPNPPTV